MKPDLPQFDPVAVLIIGGGGLGGGIHRSVDRALDTVAECDRRLIRSISLDSDSGSFDARTANQYQIGQITNTESGGYNDPSIVQAVVVRDNGRRSADSMLNRNFGARGDRVAGHKAFEDDFATREWAMINIARELKKLDAMSPSRIDVIIFGGVAGAIGSNLLLVGAELVEEAARRAGIKADHRVILRCASPNLVMADIRPQYLDENTVATLRDVNMIASGYQYTFLIHNVAPRVPDEIYFDEINYRSSLLHSNSGAEESQRAIPASIVEIVRTAIDLARADTGAILRANFINTIKPESENVFRIAQGQGVYVPARGYSDIYEARVVVSFLDIVIRKKPSGEAWITSSIATTFDQEVSTGVDGAKVLFQELHQSFLIAGSDPDGRLVPDGSWQHVVEILGADPDRTIFPIEEAIRLYWLLHTTIDRGTVARFAEDLSNHHEAALAEARETFGTMRQHVVAAVAGYLRALFDRVINGRGAYAEERNRTALFAAVVSLLELHLDRVLASWRAVFNAVATVPDDNGGLIDKRKLLTEQIDGELSQLSKSIACRWVPFVGWVGLRYVRGLAAERLDIDLLDIAIQYLDSMVADVRQQLRIAQEWAMSCSSILDGIEREAKRSLAAAETSLATTKSYGPAILVGEDRLRSVLAVIERQESERLMKETQWSLDDGRVVGRVSTVALEQAKRGIPTPTEKNYELASRAARVACRQAAAQVDVTSSIAEEFESPERLLDTLRRSVNPEAEVELDGIKSSAQPAKSIVVSIPRLVAADAVDYFDEFKRALRDEEKVIFTDAPEVRYISAIAGVPLQRIRLVCRAARAYVNSDRVLHVNEMLERARLVSRELHRVRGVTWMPPVSIAGLLEDPVTLRAIAIATTTGLLRGVEVKAKGAPVSVWATTGRKPSSANPPVTVTGMQLLRHLHRDPMRGDVSKAVERFDAQSAERRLDALTRAEETLMNEPPACLGDDKDLMRLIDIALMAEITRLQRTTSAERLGS